MAKITEGERTAKALLADMILRHAASNPGITVAQVVEWARTVIDQGGQAGTAASNLKRGYFARELRRIARAELQALRITKTAHEGWSGVVQTSNGE